jgi:hypothetical protein
LEEIGIANDLIRKVELLAGDDVGIMRRFDQRFDYRQERTPIRPAGIAPAPSSLVLGQPR